MYLFIFKLLRKFVVHNFDVENVVTKMISKHKLLSLKQESTLLLFFFQYSKIEKSLLFF